MAHSSLPFDNAWGFTPRRTSRSSKDTLDRQESFSMTVSANLRDRDMRLPKCVECSRNWPYPREVSFLAGVPQDLRRKGSLSFFEPVSTEGLVIYQTWERATSQPHLREEIFGRLKLTHTLPPKHKMIARCMNIIPTSKTGQLEYHRLVTEFDYNRKTGDVTHCSEFFDGEQETDFRYARLVTLNSWYMVLLKNLVQIIVDIFSLATGVMMLGQLYCQDGGFISVNFVQQSRMWFSVWYFGCLFVALILSARAAYWEWKASSSPNVGDIIIKCHIWDRALAFTALTLLIFLGVDKLVKDIIVVLHPWKSVQPYAAVKFEGVRCHIVGYKSRPLFHVENNSGQYYVLQAQGMSKIISFIYKVAIIIAIAYQNGDFDFLAPSPSPESRERVAYQFTLCVSTVFSMMASAVAIKKIKDLQQQRRLLKEELFRILSTAKEKGDTAKQGPAIKLLALHFHQEYNHESGRLEKAKANKFKVVDDNKCSTCGRAWTPTSETTLLPRHSSSSDSTCNRCCVVS